MIINVFVHSDLVDLTAVIRLIYLTTTGFCQFPVCFYLFFLLFSVQFTGTSTFISFDSFGVWFLR